MTIFRQGLFHGQSALITGGGSGIGAAIAEELGQLGARVAICGRRAEQVDMQAESLREKGVEVYASVCDIRDGEAVEAFVGAALERFGAIDVLVNNAGGQFISPAEHLSDKGFEAVVRNNLLGTWKMTRAVATAAMIPARRGAIIQIVAEVSRGLPGLVHTGAARAGVINMTKTLAVEWARYGVRVNSVAPGFVATEGVKQYPPEIRDRAVAATPLKRAAQPEEIAALVAYLASPAASFITGQLFTIDGGSSLWGDLWEIPDPPKGPGEENG